MSVIIPPAPAFPPNTYNYSPLNLPKWRTALGRVKSGNGNARILCLGDSTSFGYGSNGSSSGNLKAMSYPTQLAGLFNAVGINAHWNSFLGNQFGTGNACNSLNDSRLTFGSGWSYLNNSPTIGGYLFSVSASASGALSFAPTVNVDTFVVYYLRGNEGSSARGKFQMDINGGTPTVVDTDTGSDQIVSATITGTLGSNTLNLHWNANGNVYIIGVEAYDSSKKWVSIVNAGWPNAKSGDVAGTNNPGWAPLYGISMVPPDLTLLNIGINDQNNAIAISTFSANVQAIITAAQASGDVVLVTYNQSNPGTYASASTQSAYIAALYQLAAANNLVLIDTYARWVSYSSSNALGLNFDGLHPNGLGYADIARSIMNVIGAP